jgi:hypothetical protein
MDDAVSMPQPLDREGSRRNLALIAAWRARVEHEYGALLGRSDPTQPVDAEAIRAFENACRDDQEWAAGYEAGRADAARVRDGEEATGPGISWFGDGYSASLTRQDAYDLGLSDGRS